jgi:dTDP-4-dehydrorhamnose reductase
LAATVPPAVELTKTARQELDVTQAHALERALAELKPHVVLNASAYTDVDGAERETERAFEVNGRAPTVLGQAAARIGALVVHYSTDYVFDGIAGRPLTEDVPPKPINQYGASKLEGERALAASGAKHLIIRTQWLFGIHGKAFPRTMWERATKKLATRVVNDQFGRPTYSVDLARATWTILDRFAFSAHRSPLTAHPQPDVLHIANTGVTTWYDIARRIFHAGHADDLLQPCSSAEFPRPARRPAWSVLDTNRFDSLAAALPPWEDALDRFLVGLQS